MSSRPQQSGVHGRRKGKKLRSYHSQLLSTLLPNILFDASVASHLPSTDKFEANWLEIGFGGGEHLAAQARANPAVHFLGCETFVNGVAKLLAEVDATAIGNLRIYPDDAVQLLGKLPSGSFDRIYLLFPDPWPKRRQKKRRFINEDNLGELARILKTGGEFRFATDIDDYAGWTLSQILNGDLFSWTPKNADDWTRPWQDHCQTRYERKALESKRQSMYLSFFKSETTR